MDHDGIVFWRVAVGDDFCHWSFVFSRKVEVAMFKADIQRFSKVSVMALDEADEAIRGYDWDFERSPKRRGPRLVLKLSSEEEATYYKRVVELLGTAEVANMYCSDDIVELWLMAPRVGDLKRKTLMIKAMKRVYEANGFACTVVS